MYGKQCSRCHSDCAEIGWHFARGDRNLSITGAGASTARYEIRSDGRHEHN